MNRETYLTLARLSHDEELSPELREAIRRAIDGRELEMNDNDPPWLRSLVEGLGFVYWPGADTAPDDWDGGPVLHRDPGRWSGPGAIWKRMPASPDRDVIGYRRKISETAATE